MSRLPRGSLEVAGWVSNSRAPSDDWIDSVGDSDSVSREDTGDGGIDCAETRTYDQDVAGDGYGGEVSAEAREAHESFGAASGC